MQQEPPGQPKLDTRHPFTRAQALASGLDPRVLRSADYHRLLHGVYVSTACPITPQLLAEAALVTQPRGAFVSHQTAARLLDIPIPDHADEHVTVRHEDDRRRRRGVRCHIASADARVGLFRGVPISMPTQLFVELAEFLSFVDLVVAGDALVGHERVTVEELVGACHRSSDQYARLALRAAKYVRQGVDSPMETRLRLLIVLAGLPEPKVNHVVHDDRGNPVRRFDLSYPGLKLLVEYDGRQHADDPAQYDSDVYRREDLDRWGWRLVIVTAKGIYVKPEETLFRVRRALAERDATGLPRSFSDEWRPHFPVRKPVRRSS